MAVAVSTVASLNELCHTTLQVSEACLATTVGGVPARSYVSPARPPFDCCPFLAVYAAQIGEETTSPLSPPAATGGRQRYGRINLITLRVLVLRCGVSTDGNGVANADEIEAVALEVQEDGWALWCGFHNAIQAGDFLDRCSDIHFDFGRPVEERGMCVGWDFQLRADLGGIPGP